MFFRSAPPPSEALFVIVNSYANAEDAAKAFKKGGASAKTVHRDGKVQFADRPGKTLAYDNDRLLAKSGGPLLRVRSTTASRVRALNRSAVRF